MCTNCVALNHLHARWDNLWPEGEVNIIRLNFLTTTWEKMRSDRSVPEKRCEDPKVQPSIQAPSSWAELTSTSLELFRMWSAKTCDPRALWQRLSFSAVSNQIFGTKYASASYWEDTSVLENLNIYLIIFFTYSIAEVQKECVTICFLDSFLLLKLFWEYSLLIEKLQIFLSPLNGMFVTILAEFDYISRIFRDVQEIPD